MAWQDRQYSDDSGRFRRGGVPGVSAPLPAVTLWLLVINVLIFLVDSILTGSQRGDVASPYWWGHFSLERGIYGFQLWRPITYQFIHGGIFHLIFNLIGLWVFGSLMEQWWGSKRYLAFYLVCGVFGALVFSIISLIPAIAMTTPLDELFGASGCVFGLIVGCMVKYPKQPIGLFFIPITFTIFAIGAVYMALNLLQVLAGSEGAGSAVAHLGGAGMGYLLIRYPSMLNWADRLSASAVQEGVNRGRYERRVRKEQAHQAEVDRILDKVRDQGIASLSRREKKTLAEETNRQREAS